MSIQAKLYVNGQVFNLRRFNFGFTQNTNHNGIPCSAPKQTGITTSVNMVKDSIFEDWVIADRMKKDIEIHMVHNVLGQGRTRVLKCYDCFLVNYETEYIAYSSEVSTNHLMFTCGAIEASWSTAIFVEEAWGKMPTKDELVTVIEEELEPNFSGYYFEDQKGNEIPKSKLKPNQDITLVIQTENAEGDTITIDLDDDNLDYKHNGLVLEKDILSDISITSDETRIELTVVKQN